MGLKNERGAILIMAIGIVLVLLLMGILFINILTTDVRVAAGTENSTIALYIAESGLNYALPMIDFDSSWRAGVTMNFNGGSFTVTLIDSDGGTVWIKSVGIYKAAQRIIKAKVRVGNWPMFKYCPERTGYSFPQHITAKEMQEKWFYTTGGEINSSPAVDRSRVVFGSDDHKVYCLRATDGEFLWSYTTGGPVISSPAIYKEYVYIGSNDGNFYCFNMIDGGLVWSYRNEANPQAWQASPAVWNDVVYTASNDGKVYAFDYLTGTIKTGWPYLIGTNVGIYSSPAIDTTDEVLYIGADNNYFYALDLLNGTLIPGWPINMGGAVKSTACISDSGYWLKRNVTEVGGTYIYQCSFAGVVCSFTPNGSLHWTTKKAYGMINSSPVYSVEMDRIYVGSGDRKLYGFRCADGKEDHSFSTKRAVDATGAVQNDQLFIGNDDNYISARDTDDLHRRFAYDTGGNVDSSPAIYGNNLYVGSDSGRLYKFASQVTPTGTINFVEESWRDTY